MTQATADLFASPCLNFKGSLFPLTILELAYFDEDKFVRELKEKAQQAPNLFKNLPVVLSLEKLPEEHPPLDFKHIIKLCRQQGMQLVAARSKEKEQLENADRHGLACLPATSENSARSKQSDANRQAVDESPLLEDSKDSDQSKSASEQQAKVGPGRSSQIITQPIRSGQQIYAKDSDLVVMAAVSAGAEVLADGHIHIYAPLRGRALAGVKGDASARIFCRNLEAELVSIAGHYKISEDLQSGPWKASCQIFLDENERLAVQAL